MTFIPTGDNIIVKQDVLDNKTKSGIIIPDHNGRNKNIDRGVIVAMGRGRILNDGSVLKPSLSIKDHVIYNRYCGTEIQDEDALYLILKENDVLAVIKD